MVLTADNVLYYLLDQGFADRKRVVDGDFRVWELSRRNQTFKVDLGAGESCVVKQVRKWRQANLATFEREVEWYGLLDENPHFAPLAEFLPKCYGYDDEHQILILELPPGAEDLSQFHRRLGRFPPETGRLIGETLGTFHTVLSEAAREELRREFPCEVPWALRPEDLTEDAFDSISAANSELLRVLRKYAGFGKALGELRARWQPETLINGDMKWDHCVLTDQEMGVPRLYFVDWEMADFGDPCWDAGAICQDYLNAWVRSLPSAPGTPIDELVLRARVPLDEIRLAIQSFWLAYTARIGANRPASEEMLHRMMGYAAARMIQAAYQGLQQSEQITAHAVLMLQLSLNILVASEEAVHWLIGV